MCQYDRRNSCGYFFYTSFQFSSSLISSDINEYSQYFTIYTYLELMTRSTEIVFWAFAFFTIFFTLITDTSIWLDPILWGRRCYFFRFWFDWSRIARWSCRCNESHNLEELEIFIELFLVLYGYYYWDDAWLGVCSMHLSRSWDRCQYLGTD